MHSFLLIYIFVPLKTLHFLPHTAVHWKGMHSNKNMGEITIFLIEIRAGKEKDHIQYSLEIILSVELLLLSESSCQQQQITLYIQPCPQPLRSNPGDLDRTDGTRCAEI